MLITSYLVSELDSVAAAAEPSSAVSVSASLASLEEMVLSLRASVGGRSALLGKHDLPFTTKYRLVQLNFISEIEVFFMLLNRCHCKNRKGSI